MTREEFIKRSISVHGGKYDYSKVEYINSSTKVCIICPVHGEFWQLPHNHIQGKGCSKCSKRHIYSTDEIKEEFKKIHGDKYDYTKVEYNGIDNKVTIICKEHGEFHQTPWNHIHLKQGCPKCAHRSYKYTTEEWVKKAKTNTKNKCLDFSKVNYINNKTKVEVICLKHGNVMVSPLYLTKVGGCPLCKKSKLEEYIADVLIANKIVFERQKKFDYLGKQSLDFYLPEHNIAIECQGEQHFKPVDFGGYGEKWAIDRFKKTVELDNIKKQLCEDNGLKLLYFGKEKNKTNLFTDKESLLNEIYNSMNNDRHTRSSG